MKRSVARWSAVLLLWLLVPGLGELVENGVHLLREGHFAHAVPQGDDHTQGSEHGCTGTLHLCGCCVNLSLIPHDLSSLVPDVAQTATLSQQGAHVQAFIAGGLYHPPRA